MEVRISKLRIELHEPQRSADFYICFSIPPPIPFFLLSPSYTVACIPATILHKVQPHAGDPVSTSHQTDPALEAPRVIARQDRKWIALNPGIFPKNSDGFDSCDWQRPGDSVTRRNSNSVFSLDCLSFDPLDPSAV
jgi:hypothetical protein